ncbi:protein CNPPD1 [Ostrinia nubilalis]|uniref:protein CNPPD1 n=1 Tax=Ostrinia nubilalis TaxID=29057 RepID=UPI003082369B
MSSVSKRRKEGSRAKIKSMGDHKEFLKRITKTLYYGQLPVLPCLSLPVTEISCELWSVSQRGRSLRRLHADAAARLARGACVSPCALVLALLYLERLRAANPHYLAATPPADLFLVSLMVGNKFLQDDGEDDEVICSEWAASGGIDLKTLKKLEVEFLSAIDWNVFVSEKSFESRLQWLERAVALRQAAARGYFTYADLAAACDAAMLAALARAAAAAAALLAAAAAVLLALAGAALLARAALAAHSGTAAAARPVATFEANVIASEAAPARPAPDNDTVELATRVLDDALREPERPACCGAWARRGAPPPAAERRAPEAWWSPAVSWLHQNSLVGLVRRWLGRAARREWAARSWGPQPHCQWLNLSRLGALAAAVSDR